MHVQLTVQVHLKDRPADFLGVTGETVVIGKTEQLNFGAAVYLLLKHHALPYYCQVYSAEELSAERDRLIEWLGSLEFQDVEKEDDDGEADHARRDND